MDIMDGLRGGVNEIYKALRDCWVHAERIFALAGKRKINLIISC